MGFPLRFMLGLFLILVICPKSKTASTWSHMKLLSEGTTLEPLEKASGDINNGSRDEEEQKPKADVNRTDETNKIVNEFNNNNKEEEEDIEPVLIEENNAAPLPVTENNDLSKESLELGRGSHSKSIKANVNIEKFLSPDFHNKNNVYKLPSSPDIEKYIKPPAHLETTTNYDYDKKFQAIKNDIDKKLGYLDEKHSKSPIQYEETTPQVELNLIKYKNTSSISQNGNKVYKDEQVESGRNIDYSSSYNLSTSDEQNHILREESTNDDKNKNGTDDFKNKIFREKTTIDPEVLHEKLNQTERRTALLSNKIELDNLNDNRRQKWSFHYASSTVPYATTTGQKEEIMFVPYTDENPINISKRGSTKFIDTITATGKPVEDKEITRYKENKTLDEAAVENQVYPVQVPAPNRDMKEETTESFKKAALPTVTEARTTSSFKTTTEHVSEIQPITSNAINLESTRLPVTTTSNTPTTLLHGNVDIKNSTLYMPVKTTTTPGTFDGQNTTLSSLLKPENSTEEISTVHSFEENSTVGRSEVSNPEEISEASSSGSASEQTTTLVTPKQVEESSTLHSSLATSLIPNVKNSTEITGNEENSTVVIGTTPEEITTINYVSDQTVVANTTLDYTTLKELPGTTTEDVKKTETATTIPDTTTGVDTSLQPSTPAALLEKNISTKLDEVAKSTLQADDRTSSSRDLKNFTGVSQFVTTPAFGKESQVETTSDYRDNVIKQGETLTSTTESIGKIASAPTPTERKPNTGFSTPEPIMPEDTSGDIGLEEPEDSNGGKIAAVVISCIGALCFIILAILLFVMRKRHKRFNYGQRCTPVSLDAYSVDNVSVYNSVRRKGMMRASKRSYGNPAFDESSVTHMLNFPELIRFSSNSEEIVSEYDDIPQISVQTNELPDGCEIKNRYANVIPLPESRVYLSMVDECPNSDYINANFVTGPRSTKGYYIACQAPMQSTVDDFWRMIWEQQSRVVLMLTHLFENGAEKCFDYLPPSEVLDCHRLFGDFQITLKKREVKEKYVISSLQLKNMVSNTWREVTHLWYLGWPERGVPVEESSLVAFLIEARSYVKAAPSENGKVREPTVQASNGAEQNPVVIHCSPGTGRTGTVIACDIAIREFELTRQIDIPKTVYQIRRNRAGAVQTKEQYAFIYRVITWYANKLTGGVLDSF